MVAEKALKGRGRKMDVEEVVVVDVVEISNSFLTPLVGSCNAAPTVRQDIFSFFSATICERIKQLQFRECDDTESQFSIAMRM